ncbi:MAG TPA: aminotransferase class III-fold pyridoxal phosphate-dependent enzyme, partial [Spirochaetota bacterium]|nr:aminotransferase class III-fold pyridoxal phosphate-dependent enzyme [Spirochaetota bacterium]
CRKEGIVLIIDDVRCGFRLDLAGSHNRYGFTPDLVCFCKAIANGHPISALMGRDALKNTVAETFFTGSYWFSSAPMAAALACLKELQRIKATEVLADRGKKLAEGLTQAAASHGYNLAFSGEPAMPYFRITDDETQVLHQEWCAECTMMGAYLAPHHNWFMTTSHSDKDIKKTIDIADKAFTIIKKRYGSGQGR